MVVLTDGNDCHSSTWKDNPAGCGTFLRHRFNHEPSNFMCLIGCGGTIDRGLRRSPRLRTARR